MFNLTTKAYIAVTEIIYDFKNEQRGVATIEYGLIAMAMAALVALVFSANDSFISVLRSKFDELVQLVSK